MGKKIKQSRKLRSKNRDGLKSTFGQSNDDIVGTTYSSSPLEDYLKANGIDPVPHKQSNFLRSRRAISFETGLNSHSLRHDRISDLCAMAPSFEPSRVKAKEERFSADAKPFEPGYHTPSFERAGNARPKSKRRQYSINTAEPFEPSPGTPLPKPIGYGRPKTGEEQLSANVNLFALGYKSPSSRLAGNTCLNISGSDGSSDSSISKRRCDGQTDPWHSSFLTRPSIYSSRRPSPWHYSPSSFPFRQSTSTRHQSFLFPSMSSHEAQSLPQDNSNGGLQQGLYDPYTNSAANLASQPHGHQQAQMNPYSQDPSTTGGGSYYQSSSFAQPLQYHLYAPLGPHREALSPYQKAAHDFFIPDSLREELQRKSDATQQTLPSRSFL